MIRKAVGAIICKGDQILLVYKVKISDTKQGSQSIKGEWDFPKGGIKESDRSIEEALYRELEEETGSRDYTIIKQFNEKIAFEFPDDVRDKIGFDCQETTMFLVEFLGEEEDLQPKDAEINDLKFIEMECVLHTLTHEDTKYFFKKNYLINDSTNE